MTKTIKLIDFTAGLFSHRHKVPCDMALRAE